MAGMPHFRLRLRCGLNRQKAPEFADFLRWLSRVEERVCKSRRAWHESEKPRRQGGAFLVCEPAEIQFGTAFGFGGKAEFFCVPRKSSIAMLSCLSSFASGGM